MKMRQSVQQIARRIGLSIRLGADARPLDFTHEEGITPMAASYLAAGRPYFIRVPMEHLSHLGHMAFPLVKDGPSPFVRALLDFKSGKISTYEGSILQAYYSCCQPKHAGDLLSANSSMLTQSSALAAPYFWQSDSLEQTFRRRQHYVASENRQYNRNIRYESGNPLFGPCSREKGEIELLRLTSVLESIQKRGYKTDLTGVDSISGFCLHDHRVGKWRVVITTGNHRSAAMAALGHDGINVQIAAGPRGGILNREDACYWPIVQNRILTPEQALNLFDRMIDAEQPSCAQPWLKSLDGARRGSTTSAQATQSFDQLG